MNLCYTNSNSLTVNDFSEENHFAQLIVSDVKVCFQKRVPSKTVNNENGQTVRM